MDPNKRKIFEWSGYIGKKYVKIILTRRSALVTHYNPKLNGARFYPGSYGYERAKHYIRRGMFL